MLSLSDVFEAQSKYGVNEVYSDTETVTYEVYLIGCRRNLTDKTPIDYYSWDVRRQNDFTDNLIIEYVQNNPKNIEGFVNSNGEIEQDKIIDKLRIDIVDFGILREALEDDTVQEIQMQKQYG